MTADLRRRFLREAEAAAALDHRHIVPIYEAGSVGPICYIAAAYCPGLTLSQWLSERGQVMAPRLAAEVMSVLASAVAHAHQRGVLHRDIKPGNVLVQSADESGPRQLVDSVRLTDFGLARVAADSTEDSMSAAILGTPAYMAPEQAANRRTEIGVATDIYGLGATLYHLLTGRPPIVGSSQIETLSAILSSDPVDPAAYRNEIPRDLSAICMKCLEKEPPRRYASAADLQADLQRFLRGQQVLARPVGQLQRLHKWCRRNPMVASLSAVSVLAGMMILAVSLAGWWSTSRALRREQAALALADEAYNETKEAVDRYYVTISENQLLNTPGMTSLRKELLGEALEYYTGFVRRHQQDAAAAEELRKAYVRIGNVQDQLGEMAAARNAYERALELVSLPASNEVDARRNRLHQAMMHRKLARLDRRSNDLGAALRHADMSLQVLEDLISQGFELVKCRDELAQTLSNKASILQSMGKLQEAVQLYEQGESLLAQLLVDQNDSAELRLRLAQLRGNRSIGLRLLGQVAESKPLLQSSVEIYQDLVRDYPEIASYRENLGKGLANLSLYESTGGDLDAALDRLAEATNLFDQLATDYPRVSNYHTLSASTRKEAASILSHRGRLDDAERLLTETVQIYEAHAAQSAGIVFPDLHDARLMLGTVILQAGDAQRARPLIEAATEGFRQAWQTTPHNFFVCAALGSAFQQQASLSSANDQFVEAMDWLDQGLEVLQPLQESMPGNRQVDELLAANYACRASVLERQHEFAQAVVYRKQALEGTADNLRCARQAEFAAALARAGKLTQAESELAEAEAAWTGQGISWLSLARAHAVLASVYVDGLPSDAVPEPGPVDAASAELITRHQTKSLDALRQVLRGPTQSSARHEILRHEEYAVLQALPEYVALVGSMQDMPANQSVSD